MSYYRPGQIVKYRENERPLVLPVSSQHVPALLAGSLPGEIALLARSLSQELERPHTVLSARHLEAPAARLAKALKAAIREGLEPRDICLLVAACDYELHGPAGSSGGFDDPLSLPAGAIPHDEYWRRRELEGEERVS